MGVLRVFRSSLRTTNIHREGWKALCIPPYAIRSHPSQPYMHMGSAEMDHRLPCLPLCVQKTLLKISSCGHRTKAHPYPELTFTFIDTYIYAYTSVMFHFLLQNTNVSISECNYSDRSRTQIEVAP